MKRPRTISPVVQLVIAFLALPAATAELPAQPDVAKLKRDLAADAFPVREKARSVLSQWVDRVGPAAEAELAKHRNSRPLPRLKAREASEGYGRATGEDAEGPSFSFSNSLSYASI